MGFLDNISRTIADVGQTTLQKGKGMMDVAKYNSMISEEEKNIQRLYEAIGAKYFESFADSPDDLFAQYISEIKASKQKIVEYNKTLETLKGVIPCPKCGTPIPQGSAFCATCGTAIEGGSMDGVKRCECGAVIPEGVKFCTFCGKPVDQ